MKEWTKKALEEQIVGKMHANTIPVDIRLEGRQRVLDMSEMEALLREARILSQNECGCRQMMKNCSKPMDGCIGIDDMAEDAIHSYGSRQVTVEQALAALKRTYDAGLVHLSYVMTGQDKPFLICSCCECCCHTLGGVRTHGYRDQLFPSKVIAVQDTGRCTGCGICVGRCPFGARKMTEKGMEYTPGECFGCGLCLDTCPGAAITTTRRRSD